MFTLGSFIYNSYSNKQEHKQLGTSAFVRRYDLRLTGKAASRGRRGSRSQSPVVRPPRPHCVICNQHKHTQAPQTSSAASLQTKVPEEAASSLDRGSIIETRPR